jgi:histidinol-phosphate aminotransferase
MIENLRSNIRAMAGYTPGEQPTGHDFIKLNTNENPFPPSPRVLSALREALAGGDRLRKYPDPLGTAFRQTAARVLGIDPDCILIGNGSDDILTIVTRAFVPEKGLIVSPTPSYLLYRTLAELDGARFQTVPYSPDWQIPSPWPIPKADLTFIANPNSPSGTTVSIQDVERLATELSGPLVVDEAYVDFAAQNALPLAVQGRVIVTRSLSKSYSLAGIRFGYAVADPALVKELVKVKDSYNCDALSLVAATAALEDQDYLRQTRARILATRARLAQELPKLGFEVCPSQANFLWCRHSEGGARRIFEELKRRGILVRYMTYEGYGYGDGLRISIGSDADIDRLLAELSCVV